MAIKGKFHTVSMLGIYLFLIVILILSLFPICWATLTSTKTNTEIMKYPYGLPKAIQWGNYVEAWKVGRFSKYTINSILITVPSVLLIVTFSLMTGYALTKLKIRGSKIILLFFLLGLMVPIHGFMVPMFYNLRNIGLLDNRVGTSLAIVGVALPFAIYLMRSSLLKVPDELIESAYIDGGNPIQILIHVVIPLVQPTISALIVLETISEWNEFLIPLITLHTDALRTISVGLTFYKTRFANDYALTAAGTMIAALPLIVVYVIFQRQLVRGILAGSLKS